MSQPLRLQPSAAVKEKRLAALLEGRGLAADDPGLAAIVDDAQLMGSLELAGFRISWEEVRDSRSSGGGAAEVRALRRARGAVPPEAPLRVAGIRAWHEALAGPVGFRRGEREREGAAPARAEFVEDRLARRPTTPARPRAGTKASRSRSAPATVASAARKTGSGTRARSTTA